MSCTESPALSPALHRALPQAFHPPARAPRGFWHRLRVMAALRRQRRDLSQLDEHLRRDIGLTEAELRREIGRPAWDIPSWWR